MLNCMYCEDYGCWECVGCYYCDSNVSNYLYKRRNICKNCLYERDKEYKEEIDKMREKCCSKLEV